LVGVLNIRRPSIVTILERLSLLSSAESVSDEELRRSLSNHTLDRIEAAVREKREQNRYDSMSRLPAPERLNTMS